MSLTVVDRRSVLQYAVGRLVARRVVELRAGKLLGPVEVAVCDAGPADRTFCCTWDKLNVRHMGIGPADLDSRTVERFERPSSNSGSEFCIYRSDQARKQALAGIFSSIVRRLIRLTAATRLRPT